MSINFSTTTHPLEISFTRYVLKVLSIEMDLVARLALKSNQIKSKSLIQIGLFTKG
jgi:hypothetical protein